MFLFYYFILCVPYGIFLPIHEGDLTRTAQDQWSTCWANLAATLALHCYFPTRNMIADIIGRQGSFFSEDFWLFSCGKVSQALRGISQGLYAGLFVQGRRSAKETLLASKCCTALLLKQGCVEETGLVIKILAETVHTPGRLQALHHNTKTNIPHMSMT